MKKTGSLDSSKIVESYYFETPERWGKKQQAYMGSLFKFAKKHIPAYAKFLKLNNFSAKKITEAPFTSKQNYFREFGIKMTTNNALKSEGVVMTSTSGSTGIATYFPRNEKIDWQYSVLAEFFLQNGPKGNTLLIDCFGMGVWIGGLITYQAFRYAALRGYPVSVITPGINKKEIFHALRELAPNFNNVILAGYPPFIKDVIDEAREEKINFKKFHTRLLFAAESFTETFRDHVVKYGQIPDLYHDTLNLYGSAELGAMAFETPLSIFIRREALAHTEIYQELFGHNRIPTLAQYNPNFVSFTEINKEILITADNVSPFLKYKIGDNGGVYTLTDIETVFKKHGLSLKALAKNKKIKLTTLPFVYVFERSDFSTKLYGAIIYPEHIREALHQNPLSRYVTGKFLLSTKTDSRHNQYMEINIELKRGLQKSHALEKKCQEIITKKLLANNAEYKNNHHSIPHKVIPKIILWKHEDPTYFKPGIKQAWITK
jgi:phenylacetate-CoA ligase